jgi:hypothetical protein
MAKNTNSSEGAEKRMANLKPFKKGKSGNPKGRAKGYKTAKTRANEMLAALADDKEPMTPIFKLILEVLNGEELKASDRLKAADMLMDRIEGKATQKVETKNEDITPPAKIELVAPNDDSKD